MSRVLLKKLLRDLWARKGGLLALCLILALGVAGFVSMRSVFFDMDDSRAAYYARYRLADFSVDLKRAPQGMIDSLKGLPNIRSVRGRVQQSVLIDLPFLVEPIGGRAIGMPADRRPVLNDIRMIKGTWFSGDDVKEVILNESFARANNLQIGQRIKALLLDKQYQLMIVGMAKSPEFVYLMPVGGLAPDPGRFGILYMPERFLQRVAGMDGAVNQIVGTVFNDKPIHLDNTLRLLEDRLDQYGVANTTPVHEQASVRFLHDELMGLDISSKIIPCIFLATAALILNVLISRLVKLQRTIIGTLKALGHSNFTIMIHYLSFGLMVGLAGGAAGLLLGRWAQLGMLSIYREIYALPGITAHWYPDLLLTGLVISIGCALAGSINGVWYAVKLEPAESMRPPPPGKSGQILLERIRFLWRRLPFRSKIVLRSIFRNPFRSGVSIFAAAISTSLLVSTLSQVDSLYYLVDFEFKRVAHQDTTIALREPRGLRSVSEVSAWPTVTRTEPQLSVPCDLGNGSLRKRMGIIGVQVPSTLLTPLDANGVPLRIPEEGLVLSRKLAQILEVQVGDSLTLRPLIAQRREVRAAVVGIVDTYLGLSAYANINYLSRLLGEDTVANSLLTASFPGSDVSSLFKAAKTRPAVVGVSERKRALEQINSTFIETLSTGIGMLILFSGAIAFGSILNAALVSISERQREIGTLRVLGYTPGQLVLIFCGESFLLNAFGIVIGCFGGIGLAELLSHAYDTELYRFPVVIYLKRLLQCAAIMLVFWALAQVIVYRMIRRFKWLTVLNVRE